MPRTPKSAEQASRENAARYNQRQRDQHPLWVSAGLEDTLRAAGVLRTRAPDHQLRLHAAQRARHRDLDARHRALGEAYRTALKAAAPHAYRAALLLLRRLQQRFESLRRPTMVCDHWHTALRKALPRSEWRATLRTIDPDCARTQDLFEHIEARLQRRAARAGVQEGLPWS